MGRVAPLYGVDSTLVLSNPGVQYVGGSKIFQTGAAICTAVVLAPSTGRW